MRRVRGIVLAGLVVLVGGCNSGDGDDDGGNASAAASAAGCVEDTRMDVYSEIPHTDAPGYSGPLGNPPEYTVNPPSGGDHLSRAAGPGVYAGLNIVPDGNLMHSLEHGYVILWYRPDAPTAEVTLVRDVAQEYRRDVLVVERPDMPTPIAATAWERRLLCERADAEVLGDFVERTRNKAPEKVPH